MSLQLSTVFRCAQCVGLRRGHATSIRLTAASTQGYVRHMQSTSLQSMVRLLMHTTASPTRTAPQRPLTTACTTPMMLTRPAKSNCHHAWARSMMSQSPSQSPPSPSVVSPSTSLRPDAPQHDPDQVDALAEWAEEEVFPRFPSEIDLTFAAIYGSAAFSQLGGQGNKQPVRGKMLDFVLAVDEPSVWHARNMDINPTDYSQVARWLGPQRVSTLTDAAGGVYYNTLVPVAGRLIKYGVTSTHTLVTDLTEWNHFYLAGRLQKPVKILRDTPRVHAALIQNLDSAIAHAIAILPDTFTERDLFATIAGLSYAGDPRMVVGENPHKVLNIVDAQMSEFRRLYGERLVASGVVTDPSGQLRATKRDLKSPKTNTALHDTVRRSSSAQMALGVVSAGPLKTVRYASEKLGKWIDGLRQSS
eukprot:m.205449 g.205449  ORF g.205449 m.205449 type:complete len:417 (+) comp22937_c0_seq1:243-1493(+)